MNNKTWMTLFIAASCAALPFAAHGANPSGSNLSPLDKTFLKDTAQSNLGELAYKPMVVKMTRQPQYLAFANRMVRDHTRAEVKLNALAAQFHYTLPSQPSNTEKELKKRLSREPKSEFDAAYKQEMIRDHTGDIAKTRREISLGRNPEVRSYAQWILPILKTHLALSKSLPETPRADANRMGDNAK